MLNLSKPIYLYPLLLFVVLGLLFVSNLSDKETASDLPAKTTKSTSAIANELQYSLTDPSSPWVVVNKHRSIPIEFSPELIVPDVPLAMDSATENMKLSAAIKSPIEKLFNGANEQNIKLRLASGYRSADTQASLYQGYVADQGQAQADRFSARPGHSEHQTGLAADIVSSDNTCYIETCWADTVEGKWLEANAHNYGFIIRYLEGKEPITGYSFEPWHIRYVGVETATKIHSNNQTMEEFFGLEAAPDYLKVDSD